VQVIVLALVLSFIIKRDSEVIDYEDAFGKMKTVDDINFKGAYSSSALTTELYILCWSDLSCHRRWPPPTTPALTTTLGS